MKNKIYSTYVEENIENFLELSQYANVTSYNALTFYYVCSMYIVHSAFLIPWIQKIKSCLTLF